MRPPSPRARPRTPRVGRPRGSFTQHHRIDKLRELLESQPLGLTIYELAATLKITPRSVRRYLDELGELTQLESAATTPGGPLMWRIKPAARGRAVPLRRSQAYAILATRRALDVLRGSALYDEADLALGQIEKIAQTPFRATGKAEISGEQGLEGRFFWLPPAARSYAARGEDLDELFRAVADLRVLRYRPRTRAGEDRAEKIAFHPYAMVVHKGSIVVLGARGARAEVDVVPFESMMDIRTSETEHFTLPTSFDIAHYVHGEFGVARPARGRFMVEFEARVGDEIRARKLHPAQKVATAPDGRVRVSLPLVDATAAASWVMSWGDAARVVEPPELARAVRDLLFRAASKYGPGEEEA